MEKPTKRHGLLFGIVVIIWAVAIYVIGANNHWWPTVNGPNWFEPQSFTDPNAQSDDLDADIADMWETEENDEGKMVSTNRAIDAANRVFNTIELVGMSGAEVKALLGSPAHSNDSIYRSSAFWPIKRRAMIYRIENGRFGWQINVYCEGDDQPVTEVEKLWIH